MKVYFEIYFGKNLMVFTDSTRNQLWRNELWNLKFP